MNSLSFITSFFPMAAFLPFSPSSRCICFSFIPQTEGPSCFLLPLLYSPYSFHLFETFCIPHFFVSIATNMIRRFSSQPGCFGIFLTDLPAASFYLDWSILPVCQSILLKYKSDSVKIYPQNFSMTLFLPPLKHHSIAHKALHDAALPS